MKKNLNRLLAMLICCILSVFIFPMSAEASENNNYDLADQAIYESIDELYNQAKTRRSSLNEYASLVYSDDPSIIYDVPVYKIDTTSITKEYLSDNIHSITLIANPAEGILRVPVTGPQVPTIDSSYSIRAILTIYYDQTSGALTKYLLTRCSGRYEKLDSSVSVTKQVVTCGCNGAAPTPVSSQTITRQYGSQTSWNIDTGFTIGVYNDGYAAMGCNSVLTLQHGSSVWSFQAFNNLF